MYRVRFLFTLVLAFALSLSISAQQLSHTVYVGSKTLLSCPDPPNGGAINQTAWGSSGAHLKVEKYGAYGCYVTVTEYFEGMEQVQCDYYWYWYDNYGYMHTNHATTFFTFRCHAVTVTPSPTSMTLSVGQGQQLSYTYSPSSVYPKPTIVLQSQNTNIATVTSSGYVKAVAPGTTTIKLANNAGPDASCQVTVRKVDPTSVSLPSASQVYVGETVTLTPTVSPSTATTTFTWYSTNSSVARVSSSGTVTGVDEGMAAIYAVSANGLRTNDCNMTVQYRRPTSVSITPSSLNLPISHQSQLTAKVLPSNAKYTLSWSGSNDVISVSPTGLVTALKAGTGVVTVRTDNGCSGSCTVTVPPDPSSVSLPAKIALTWNKSRRLVCSVTPSNAYKQLSWSSDNPAVAQVSSDGTVTARAPGAANITVRTQNGKEASCRVEVDEAKFLLNIWMRSRKASRLANDDGPMMQFDMKERPVLTYSNGCLVLESKSQRIELDTANVYKFALENKTADRMPLAIDMETEVELPFKGTKQLSVELLPADYDILTQIAWKSSQPAVVSVSSSGLLTALTPGQADISATASNGCTAVCRVTVPAPHYHFFVWLDDGRYDAYAFDAKPKVYYEDGDLVVASAEGSYRYANEDVHKITFSDNETPVPVGISAVQADSGQGSTLRHSGDEVRMQGMRPGGKLYVYSADGKLQKALAASAEGSLTVRLSEFAKGIYILKTETTTYKIIKK